MSEELNTFEIALRSGDLPERIEDLVPMMFAGQAAVKFMNAKLKLVNELSTQDPLGLLEKQRRKTVEDGQNVGEMLIKIMGRIGELADKIPLKESRGYSNTHEGKKAKANGGYGQSVRHAMVGLKDKNQLKAAQLIHKNPGLVAEAIKEAKSHDDIPNVTMIVQKHRHNLAMKREKDRQAEAAKQPKTAMQLGTDEIRYILILEKILEKLPKTPPKNFSEKGLRSATTLADKIINRLAAFSTLPRR